MPDTLRPPLVPSDAASDGATPHDQGQNADALRRLSRTPQPYHHQNADKLALNPPPVAAQPDLADDSLSPTAFPPILREQTPSSCSGTEADDEHFLKGLPAPRQRLHKGLRGRNEIISGTSTPIPSPAILEEEGRGIPPTSKKGALGRGPRPSAEGSRRRKEIVRRISELIIVGALGVLVQSNSQVKPILRHWSRELWVAIGVVGVLSLVYPLRLILWASQHRTPTKSIPVSIPSAFDPAPLFYPPAITLFVSSLIAVNKEAVVLPNIVLAIASLPAALIPAVSADPAGNPLHWALSCLPLFWSGASGTLSEASPGGAILPEVASLLYPLHVNLCLTLHTLTTTSLLPAELQLLSVALLNVLLLSTSPQAVILKAGLWVGGLDLLVSCSRVIHWGIALARVPKWRFKRAVGGSKHKATFLRGLIPWRRVKHDIFHVPLDDSSSSSHDGLDGQADSDDPAKFASAKGGLRVSTINLDEAHSTSAQGSQAANTTRPRQLQFELDQKLGSPPRRRHTLPSAEEPPRKSYGHTPSGRRKRSASSSVRAFFSLTQEEAILRKWQYAAYVYICIAAALFAPIPFAGILEVVKTEALGGHDAIGWALGYMLGDLPSFRWQVVSHNLERWICLPERPAMDETDTPFPLGWIPYLRHVRFGEANTRLLMCGYCVAVITVGLLVVFRLSPFYEVDTRRKVFHFMMVAMFLPLTFVDPAFVALALTVVLALFLLLDLLRASQLPPLSKPLASFLAPYVDGRDLRGPVVVSHIFLLIGCAIPLWLSLGTLPRAADTGPWAGWEVPAREISMVAGVVCVGLGDAAASLIGRRYGRSKWLWGGGKSLEGSAAFALAVFAGLGAVHLWLWAGGWPAANGRASPWGAATLGKTGACATVASLTEAVLTGGNDNVIVPVVLWTCVKSLDV